MAFMSNDACSSYNREKRRINPNKTCSGSVVEGFIWLYTGDRFRQREICMTCRVGNIRGRCT